MIISSPVDGVTTVSPLPAVARGNLTDRVQHLLRERILSGEWPAGTRLPAIERLATDAGVSRTVAREAVKALSTQGLLEVIHGHGTVVAASTNRPVVEALRHSMRAIPDLIGIVEVRLALEVEAAALAAERRTEEDLATLRRASGRLLALRLTPRLSEFVRADVAFHEAVVRATHNPIFAMVAESISELLQETRLAIVESGNVVQSLSAAGAGLASNVSRSDTITDNDHLSASRGAGPAAGPSSEAHAEILSRIEAGDREGAATAMRWHLTRVRDNIDTVVRRRGGAARTGKQRENKPAEPI
jgi:GntR family transcriptional regulator, transcriptional repressor for pyruvate dehydrogenase complex